MIDRGTRTSPGVPLEERERLRQLAEKVLESERGMPMVEPVVVDGKEFQAMYVSMADVEIAQDRLSGAVCPDVVLRLLAMLDDTEKTLREADDLLRRLEQLANAMLDALLLIQNNEHGESYSAGVAKTCIASLEERRAVKCPTCHAPEACDSSATCPNAPSLPRDLLVAERQFLIASTNVWYEIDRLTGPDGTYAGLAQSTLLRQHERATWAAYRDLMERHELMICPRCEGQAYDRGSCCLCENTGYTRIGNSAGAGGDSG